MTTIFLNTPNVEATLNEGVWTCEIASIERMLNWQTAQMNPPPVGIERWIAQNVCNNIGGGGKIVSEPEEVPREPGMIY